MNSSKTSKERDKEKLALKKNTPTAKPEYNLILQVMNTVAGTMTLDINQIGNANKFLGDIYGDSVTIKSTNGPDVFSVPYCPGTSRQQSPL